MRAISQAGQLVFKIGDGFDQTVFKSNLGFPAKLFTRQSNIGLALLGIVAGQGFVRNHRLAAGHFHNLFGQFTNGKFAGVAHVHGADKVNGRGHEADHALNQIIHIAERAGLRAIAINGDGLALERLDDEV